MATAQSVSLTEQIAASADPDVVKAKVCLPTGVLVGTFSNSCTMFMSSSSNERRSWKPQTEFVFSRR